MRLQSVRQITNVPAAPWWRPESATREATRDTKIAPAGAIAREQRSSTLPFAALMCFTFILLTAPQGIFTSLRELRVAFLTGMVAAAAHLADRFLSGAGVWRFEREVKIAVWLFLWAFVTVPLCYWPGGSLEFLTGFYLKTLLIYWLLSNTVDTPSRIRRTLWLLIVLMAVVALAALSAYSSGTVIESAGFARISGYDAPLTNNPNDLALMLSLMLPLALALVYSTRSSFARLVLYACIAIFVSTIVLTFSRSGFLDLVVAAILLMAKQRKRARSGWKVGVLVAAVALFAVLPENYGDRIATIYDIQKDETGSANARWESMIAAGRFVGKNPVIGAGAGMGILALNEEQGAIWKAIHNVYLQTAVELGLPGLALYVMLVIAAIRASRIAQQRFAERSMQDMVYVAEGLEISLIVFAVGGFFSPVAYHYYFYYIAGLAVAARVLSTHGGSSSPPEPIRS